MSTNPKVFISYSHQDAAYEYKVLEFSNKLRSEKKRIEVNVVKDFYDFFVSQTDVIKNIILNNLYGRFGNIPVVYNVFDEELPFS